MRNNLASTMLAHNFEIRVERTGFDSGPVAECSCSIRSIRAT